MNLTTLGATSGCHLLVEAAAGGPDAENTRASDRGSAASSMPRATAS
jgi:hypothetical protein